MSNDQSKVAVLNRLKAQTSPITLPELMQALGAEYTERTIRRWLSEWVKSGVVVKSGQKRGTHYFIAEAKSTAPVDVYFSEASQEVIKRVKMPYELRKSVTYHPEWLLNYKPNVDFYLSASELEVLNQAGNRAKKYKAAGTYARQIYNRLLIDLSYNSSRLEGNTYSLLETERLIIDGTASPDKLDEEKTMILNHKEAIRFLVGKSNQPALDEMTICTLHYLLSDGLVSPQYAGKVRDYGVRIGGSTYLPLENPKSLQHYLNTICDKANLINNPYEKSIFLLAHFAYLQPFVDVNKRTSRLSANFPLFHANLVPLSFEAIKQSDYVDAMIAIYELNNIKPLVDLYLYSYLRTAEKYDATIEAIGFDRVRVQYRQQRRELIKHIILNGLHGNEIDDYVNSEAVKFVEPLDILQFARNIQEDLEQLAPSNIIGIGITIQQVNAWRKK